MASLVASPIKNEESVSELLFFEEISAISIFDVSVSD
jgi:hypothetical protein